MRWSYIITTPSQSTPREHTYMWCNGEVASVADGTSNKKSEKARTLLPAGAVHFKWPADVERDEPESFTWIILHPAK
eukprot:4222742-Pleurochrysis_carterae.AAC.1